MPRQKQIILDQQHINWKLRRMAFQIWEANSNATEITMIGIEHSGVTVAENLASILNEISPLKISLLRFRLDKKNPLNSLPEIKENLDGKSVVLVDDVANSGRTLLYALKPILSYAPSKILIAVLVDRKHKAFPVSPDIVGHTLSTTLQEHIEVEHKGNEIVAAYLL